MSRVDLDGIRLSVVDVARAMDVAFGGVWWHHKSLLGNAFETTTADPRNMRSTRYISAT